MSLLKTTQSALESLGASPLKKLGQNFMIDAHIIEKAMDMSEVVPEDVVVEIGPGLGSLTAALLEKGAVLYAVEYDRKFFGFLQEKWKNCPQFHLCHADAVDRPVGDLPKEVKNFKVVANLPYAISSAWMGEILNLSTLPTSMTLLVQWETAQRFFSAENTRDRCPLSLFLQSSYTLGQQMKVGKKCFYPAPKVESALIHMRRKSDPFFFSPSAKEVINTLFSMRRKQLGGTIEKLFPTLYRWMEDQNIDPKMRPENLLLEQWQSFESYLPTQN